MQRGRVRWNKTSLPRQTTWIKLHLGVNKVDCLEAGADANLEWNNLSRFTSFTPVNSTGDKVIAVADGGGFDIRDETRTSGRGGQ